MDGCARRSLSDQNRRNAREYKAITTALRTYKDNLQQKLSTCQFQKGFLVLLNGSTIPFANKHPVGKIQKIKKRDVNFPIEIIHMRANNDGTKLIPIPKSSGTVSPNDIVSILCTEKDPLAQML
eukprot:28500_1